MVCQEAVYCSAVGAGLYASRRNPSSYEGNIISYQKKLCLQVTARRDELCENLPFHLVGTFISMSVLLFFAFSHNLLF